MRLADLTLHDCPLNRVLLDFAGATLRLGISQYHEARQAYDEYELTFRGITDFSWTDLHDFHYGDDLEITDYAELAAGAGLRLRFVLLTGSGGPSRELAFRCAGYEVWPVAT